MRTARLSSWRDSPLAAWINLWGYDPANRGACFLWALAAIVVSGAPMVIFGFQLPMVWLSLVPVFVLALCRPSRRSLVLAFLIGLLQDLALAGPVGPFALGHLWAYLVGMLARPSVEGGSAVEISVAFAMCAAVNALAALLLAGLALKMVGLGKIDIGALSGLGPVQNMAGPGYSLAPLFGQWLMTVLVAPIVFPLFGGFDRLRRGTRLTG
jgi:cell shape-determining protein MreD